MYERVLNFPLTPLCSGNRVFLWGRITVQEEAMGKLIFVCPATGQEVSTGIEMELATLERLEWAKIYCPHCRQQHQMAGIEYWLTEEHLLEPMHDEDVKAA
jgi:hypothetical protein